MKKQTNLIYLLILTGVIAVVFGSVLIPMIFPEESEYSKLPPVDVTSVFIEHCLTGNIYEAQKLFVSGPTAFCSMVHTYEIPLDRTIVAPVELARVESVGGYQVPSERFNESTEIAWRWSVGAEKWEKVQFSLIFNKGEKRWLIYNIQPVGE